MRGVLGARGEGFMNPPANPHIISPESKPILLQAVRVNWREQRLHHLFLDTLASHYEMARKLLVR
jgi:hypothetical protein